MAMTHRIGLHFRSLSETDVPFDTLLRNTEKVYAQYGIRIDFLSGLCLGLSEEEAEKYTQVNGSCEWTAEGEFNDVQALGGAVDSNEILVYYVLRFDSATSFGCGGHAPGRPACIVAASGSPWTTAHEVGHVLLTRTFRPVHSESLGNLMFSNTKRISATLPCLTDAQVEQIKRSPCCKRI
jgi:hypothetical protein